MKQFTLRFNTENEIEKKALNYLHGKSYELGISQNAFLIQLLQKEMKESDMEEKDDWIERIVLGVSKQLMEQIKQSSLIIRSEMEGTSTTHINNEIVHNDDISEDAMVFLDSF